MRETRYVISTLYCIRLSAIKNLIITNYCSMKGDHRWWQQVLLYILKYVWNVIVFSLYTFIKLNSTCKALHTFTVTFTY